MKKLIKSDICGSVNSARMHCSRLKSQPLRLKAKKKKKKRKRKKKAETHFAPRRESKMRKPNIA